MITSTICLQGPPPPYSQPLWRHSLVHQEAQAAVSSSQMMTQNVQRNNPPASIQSLSVDPVRPSEGHVSVEPHGQSSVYLEPRLQLPLHNVLIEV